MGQKKLKLILLWDYFFTKMFYVTLEKNAGAEKTHKSKMRVLTYSYIQKKSQYVVQQTGNSFY